MTNGGDVFANTVVLPLTREWIEMPMSYLSIFAYPVLPLTREWIEMHCVVPYGKSHSRFSLLRGSGLKFSAALSRKLGACRFSLLRGSGLKFRRWRRSRKMSLRFSLLRGSGLKYFFLAPFRTRLRFSLLRGSGLKFENTEYTAEKIPGSPSYEGVD